MFVQKNEISFDSEYVKKWVENHEKQQISAISCCTPASWRDAAIVIINASVAATFSATCAIVCVKSTCNSATSFSVLLKVANPVSKRSTKDSTLALFSANKAL